MNLGNGTDVVQDLAVLFKSLDANFISSVYEQTGKNLNQTIEFLKTMVDNQDEDDIKRQRQGEEDISEEWVYPEEYGDGEDEEEPEEAKSNNKQLPPQPQPSKSKDGVFKLEESDDPHMQFVLQLQREELEKEERLRKQQEEDEKFAMGLHLESQPQPQANNNLANNQNNNQRFDDWDPFANPFINLSNKPAIKEPVKKEVKVVKIDDDDGTCVICMNAPRNAIFVPCAHKSCCIKCASQVETLKKFCPLCWTNLEGVIDCSTNGGL